MDPCPFLRILIGGLAIKLPNSLDSQCFCKIKLKNFPTQSTSVPIVPQHNDEQMPNLPLACFNLNKTQFDKLAPKTSKYSRPSCLKLEIYSGSRGVLCGIRAGKLIGSVLVPLDLKTGENRAQVLKNGWVQVGVKGSFVQMHMNVKAEPDPRFVFRFDGEPESSPQVFQVNGNLRQPVFTCKFSFRSDPNLRSKSSSLTEESNSKSWFSSFRGISREQSINERKGWSITIHDLSGSSVAAASMVTPFVPSPGTDRVSKSNPGAWLILRPGDGTWKPWGRLEAWLEPEARSCHLGYRFDLLPDAVAGGGGSAVTLASSSLNTKTGGKFAIDISAGVSPASSRSSSCDFGSGSGSGFGSGSWADFVYRGFVMSSTVEGKGRRGRPEVQVGVDHVACAEDAAAFVALAAAMELSMDACMPFNQKLRKELRRQESQEFAL